MCFFFQARVIPNNDKNRTYSVVYLPKVEGLHKVSSSSNCLEQPALLICFLSYQVKVLFAGQDIDGSPFMVHVSKAMGDPTRVQARGPGLQNAGNMATKPTYFDIYTAGLDLFPSHLLVSFAQGPLNACPLLGPLGAGAGDVGVTIVDSNGRRDTVEVVLENKGDSIFRCTYVPVLEGPHTVYVTFAGQQVPRSPFAVFIAKGKTLNPGPFDS